MGVDVLDLTSLHKRGLLKYPKTEETSDVMDLTQPSFQPPAPAVPAQSSTNDSSSAFDFLSGFAQASASESSHAPAVHGSMPHDVRNKLDTIINKIEDTMYKIEVLSSRVAQLEARLGR